MTEEGSAAPSTTPSPSDRPGFVHSRSRHGLVGPFSGRQLLAAGLSVVVVAVLLALANTPVGSPAASAPPNPAATAYVIGDATDTLRVGDPAPDFTAPRPDGSTFRLTDVDGHPLSLAALRGKAIWVNFWASWCPPCQAETPILRQTYQAYRDRGLVIVGISVQETNASDVAAYARQYGLAYTIAADLSGDIFHRYRVYGLPTQFFIDSTGILRSVVQGPLDATAAAQQVEAILPKG